jgi:ribonuclease VapC
VILDSSAIVAIVLREAGASRMQDAIAAADRIAVGAPTLVEAAIVLSGRLDRDARGILARLVQEAAVSVLPFGAEHFGVAVGAWLRYGKGRHAAALNFGDCLAYATATLAAEPLLCAGDDFVHTDLDLA